MAAQVRLPVYVPQVLSEEPPAAPASWLARSVGAALGGAEEEPAEEEAMRSAGAAAVSCSPNSMSVKSQAGNGVQMKVTT